MADADIAAQFADAAHNTPGVEGIGSGLAAVTFALLHLAEVIEKSG